MRRSKQVPDKAADSLAPLMNDCQKYEEKHENRCQISYFCNQTLLNLLDNNINPDGTAWVECVVSIV